MGPAAPIYVVVWVPWGPTCVTVAVRVAAHISTQPSSLWLRSRMPFLPDQRASAAAALSGSFKLRSKVVVKLIEYESRHEPDGIAHDGVLRVYESVRSTRRARATVVTEVSSEQ